MRKNFLVIVIPGIIIGILFVVIVRGISDYKAAPAAKLFEPVKTANATAADKQIQSAQTAIDITA